MLTFCLVTFIPFDLSFSFLNLAPSFLTPFAQVSMGSLYTGAVTVSGKLYVWGYGGHGNLGLGNRSSHPRPQQVQSHTDCAFRAVFCAKGQINPGGGLRPTKQGTEGPHTLAVTRSGALYAWGTCHKVITKHFLSRCASIIGFWIHVASRTAATLITENTSIALSIGLYVCHFSHRIYSHPY